MSFDLSAFRASRQQDAAFDKPVFNAEKARKAFVDRVTMAAEQISKGGKGKGRKDFVLGNNDVVRFSPKVKGVHVPVEAGSDYFPVPMGSFAEFADALIQAINAGEYDVALEAANQSEGEDTAPKKKSSAKKDKPATLEGAKKSVGIRRAKGESDADIRAALEARNTPEDIIVDALAMPRKD